MARQPMQTESKQELREKIQSLQDQIRRLESEKNSGQFNPSGLIEEVVVQTICEEFPGSDPVKASFKSQNGNSVAPSMLLKVIEGMTEEEEFGDRCYVRVAFKLRNY